MYKQSHVYILKYITLDFMENVIEYKYDNFLSSKLQHTNILKCLNNFYGMKP